MSQVLFREADNDNNYGKQCTQMQSHQETGKRLVLFVGMFWKKIGVQVGEPCLGWQRPALQMDSTIQ